MTEEILAGLYRMTTLYREVPNKEPISDVTLCGMEKAQIKTA